MQKPRLLKVAFYKKSKSFFGGVIRFQQNFVDGLGPSEYQYSHAELVFCGLTDREKKKLSGSGVQCDWGGSPVRNENYVWNDVFFSSSEEDGGTRFKNIDPKKENWDFIEIQVSEEEYQKVLNFCISQNNKRYAWFSIFFAQALKTKWLIKEYPHGLYKNWYCSQIVLRALQEAGIIPYISALFCNPGTLNMELKYYQEKKFAEQYPDEEFLRNKK